MAVWPRRLSRAGARVLEMHFKRQFGAHCRWVVPLCRYRGAAPAVLYSLVLVGGAAHMLATANTEVGHSRRRCRHWDRPQPGTMRSVAQATFDATAASTLWHATLGGCKLDSENVSRRRSRLPPESARQPSPADLGAVRRPISNHGHLA